MRRIVRLLFIIMILTVIIPIQAVFAETLEENVNNLIGVKQQYNTMLSPVYLRNNTSEEQVSSQSGELTVTQTDYVLPGRNGLDVELKRIYKSNSSNVYKTSVKYVNGAWVDYADSGEKSTSFIEERYNLGIGMRFSFPTMEVKKNNDETTFLFLHTQAGDVYRLSPMYINNVFTYVPENQTIKDVYIWANTEFSNGQDNGISRYMMSGKDGKKTYFSEDGRILGIVDRYGNTIKFEYATYTYLTKTKILMTKIIDTVGRVITIDYKEDPGFMVIGSNNVSYPQDQSYMASQGPNNTTSGDLKEKFKVIVTLPDSKKITYDKSAALTDFVTKKVIRTRLQRVYDIDNTVKYHFWYEQPDLGFTYANGNTYSVFNRYENLIQIDYFKTNRIKRFTYTTGTRKYGDTGSMQYRKVFEEKTLSKTGYDNAKPNFLDKYLTQVMDKTTYTYSSEPDGYGVSGYDEKKEDYLKNTYRYTTMKSSMRDNKVKYTYNGQHELLNVEMTGNDHKEITTSEYDDYKFPKKTEKLMYNIINGQVVGEPVKKNREL